MPSKPALLRNCYGFVIRRNTKRRYYWFMRGMNLNATARSTTTYATYDLAYKAWLRFISKVQSNPVWIIGR